MNSDRIYLGTYMHTRMYFDLVRVRKYSSPEPTTSVGEEESAPLAPPVGGVWIPISKFELLRPWVSLASLIALVAVSVVYVKHKKKK